MNTALDRAEIEVSALHAYYEGKSGMHVRLFLDMAGLPFIDQLLTQHEGMLDRLYEGSATMADLDRAEKLLIRCAEVRKVVEAQKVGAGP